MENQDTQQEVEDETTSQQGTVSATDLPSGHYAYVETQAPEGYQLNTTPQTFVEDSSNTSDKIVVNLSKADLEKDTPITIKGLSKQGTAVIINVDTEGASEINIKSQIKLEYSDGTTRNSQETEDFSDATLLWNFTNRAEGQTINVNSPFQGTLLAVGDTVNVQQNLDGSIIADTVNINSETHRWDLQADAALTPQISLHVVNIKAASQETTSLSGSKTWIDEDNKYQTRPESITVDLLQNGTKIDAQVIRADNNEDWHYTFDNLVKYDSQGAPYTYTVTEEPVAGYTATVNGTTIVNTYDTPSEPSEPSEPSTPSETSESTTTTESIQSTTDRSDQSKKLPKTNETVSYQLPALGTAFLAIAGIVLIRRKK